MMPDTKILRKEPQNELRTQMEQVEKGILHNNLDRPSALDAKEPFFLLIGGLPGHPDTTPARTNANW